MISNLGQYCFYLVMMISILNTVEYNEYKRGVRDEAIIASLRPFLTKMALIVLVTTLYLAFGRAIPIASPSWSRWQARAW